MEIESEYLHDISKKEEIDLYISKICKSFSNL